MLNSFYSVPRERSLSEGKEHAATVLIRKMAAARARPAAVAHAYAHAPACSRRATGMSAAYGPKEAGHQAAGMGIGARSARQTRRQPRYI